MATTPSITIIPKTECIGNSLVTINTNYQNIRNSFDSVNVDINTINNTLDTLTTLTNAISSAQLAKAWVKFNPALNESGNLDSNNTNRRILSEYNVNYVTKEETGKYLITFKNTINTHFTVSGITTPAGTGTGTAYTSVLTLDPVEPFPAGNQSCRIITRNLQGVQIDTSFICLTFFSN